MLLHINTVGAEPKSWAHAPFEEGPQELFLAQENRLLSYERTIGMIGVASSVTSATSVTSAHWRDLDLGREEPQAVADILVEASDIQVGPQ